MMHQSDAVGVVRWAPAAAIPLPHHKRTAHKRAAAASVAAFATAESGAGTTLFSSELVRAGRFKGVHRCVRKAYDA